MTETSRAGHGTRRPGGIWLAMGWGFAEATFFFIVPDVLTSRFVLQNPGRGVLACLWALAGALIGGSILFLAALNPQSATWLIQAFDWIPGISPALIEKARLGLHESGLPALFKGALAGVPYKLYAVQAAAAGLRFWPFLLASAAARLARFALVTTLVWALGMGPLRKLSLEARLRLHLVAWFLFYAFYFSVMSG